MEVDNMVQDWMPMTVDYDVVINDGMVHVAGISMGLLPQWVMRPVMA